MITIADVLPTRYTKYIEIYIYIYIYIYISPIYVSKLCPDRVSKLDMIILMFRKSKLLMYMPKSNIIIRNNYYCNVNDDLE